MSKKKVYIASVSGGKDSTVLYGVMMKYHGNDFIPVFADTGHEHPVTLNYVRNLHHMTGGPEVNFVKADFKDGLMRRKEMQPTGNTFLDMMLWKSAVPTSKMQFCTEHLKMWPIKFWLEKNYPSSEYEWILHTGIRGGESQKRAKMQPFEWNDFYDCLSVMPLLYEIEEWIFEFLESIGVPPNPLYELGNTRVGCYPCIFANKNQLAALPEWAWERLQWYEDTLGLRWFKDKTIAEARDWAQTSHGGKQFNMFRSAPKDAPSCMTGWIACE